MLFKFFTAAVLLFSAPVATAQTIFKGTIQPGDNTAFLGSINSTGVFWVNYYFSAPVTGTIDIWGTVSWYEYPYGNDSSTTVLGTVAASQWGSFQVVAEDEGWITPDYYRWTTFDSLLINLVSGSPVNYTFAVYTSRAVPEPAAWMMLTIAAGIIGGSTRKRRGLNSRVLALA